MSDTITWRGIKRTDGAVYVVGLASGTVVPATAIPYRGANVAPAAKFVSTDGAIYVRFV